MLRVSSAQIGQYMRRASDSCCELKLSATTVKRFPVQCHILYGIASLMMLHFSVFIILTLEACFVIQWQAYNIMALICVFKQRQIDVDVSGGFRLCLKEIYSLSCLNRRKKQQL